MTNLVLVTDSRLFPEQSCGADQLATIAKILAVGRQRIAVVLREPELSAKRLLEWALRLRSETARVGAKLWISDRCDIAATCEADGVWLPERGITIAGARLCGAGSPRLPSIGRSIHDVSGAVQAEKQGAHSLIAAPFEFVPNKGTPLGVGGFGEIARAVAIPVYALGGIESAQSVARAKQSGAAGVAVRRALLLAKDPDERTGSLLAAWDATL